MLRILHLSLFCLALASAQSQPTQHIWLLGNTADIPSESPYWGQLRQVLDHAGKISNADMKNIANQRYNAFNEQRRTVEARQADAEDLQELEEIAKQGEKGGEG